MNGKAIGAAILVTGTLFVAGCEHYRVAKVGRPINQADLSKILKGLTTKAQIREQFGPPHETFQTVRAAPIWRYCHSPAGRIEHLSIAGADSNTRRWKCLAIEFSLEGIVMDFKTSEFRQELDGVDKATKRSGLSIDLEK